ncbi:phosphopantetheine-binding protein [Gilliamella sp. WF3-4]|uniref:phosphopantetheine-binding protein n=1 Tax=Gilliamella sp. WF3-4 TaxID=3120255 RepID=UPI00080E4243|nr:phosphopantetheine-binding protein [Gilliamella apicola]OCG16946.1 hypothetical protein A9G47_09840 [Gilliamella apicola]
MNENEFIDQIIKTHVEKLSDSITYDKDTFLHELGLDSITVVSLIVEIAEKNDIDIESIYSSLIVPEKVSDLYALEKTMKETAKIN